MCSWVRIPLLSKLAFKKPTFWSKQEFWESKEKQDKRISHYKKVLSKTGWSKCDILKAGWPSGLRRQTQEILLWDFWYTNVCVGSNPTPVKFCVQKANILVEAVFLTAKSKQYFWQSNQEQDGADFTLQEGVIEDRMKQVRYTQGRMAERSKAPDSRNSPLRLLVHECVRGFESHSCQNLRSKSQNFGRSRSSESQKRSKTNRLHITRRCYGRQDEASAVYSRQDGRAV